MSKQFTQELAQKIMAELAGMLDEVAANAQELRGMLAGPINGAQLTTLVDGACRLSRDHAARAHRLKMAHDWSVPPQPEWFDHFCDLYYQFRDLRASLWLERQRFEMQTNRIPSRTGGRFGHGSRPSMGDG